MFFVFYCTRIKYGLLETTGDTPTIYAGANTTSENEKADATDKPQVIFYEEKN